MYVDVRVEMYMFPAPPPPPPPHCGVYIYIYPTEQRLDRSAFSSGRRLPVLQKPMGSLQPMEPPPPTGPPQHMGFWPHMRSPPTMGSPAPGVLFVSAEDPMSMRIHETLATRLLGNGCKFH